MADKQLGTTLCHLADLIPEKTKDLRLDLKPALDMSNVVDKKDRGSITIKVSYGSLLLLLT